MAARDEGRNDNGYRRECGVIALWAKTRIDLAAQTAWMPHLIEGLSSLLLLYSRS